MTTDGGKPVDLQGLEWLTFDETIGVSRQQIENGYKNLMNEGWRYATRQKVATRFQSLAPVYTGVAKSPEYYDRTQWLWKNFDNPSDLAPVRNSFSRTGELLIGAEGEGGLAADHTYLAVWRGYTSPAGWFQSDFGYHAALTNHTRPDTFFYPGGLDVNTAASVLVRSPSQAPEPASWAIFAVTGVVSCTTRRRRRIAGRPL
ncbi:hypothetical protein Mal15_08520 [Stieleria maiorica]|uniref:PEP-CTERM protein-sorting domain-containing protein n=1 Tax=Stieleria maiorica TaxID=2795974 RepID=A0A5B9M6T1_9BACT|nr:hypothetical protein Mal15_08520 [Stieleria maiorica]